VTPSWKICETAWPADVAGSVAALAADELAWLDSATACAPVARPKGGTPGGGPFSLIAADPIARIEQFDGRPAELRVCGRTVAVDANGWRLWRCVFDQVPRLPPPPLAATAPVPGWIGYVGFEMGRQLERLPCAHTFDLGLPLMRMALFDRAIVLDHAERRAFAVCAAGVREALGLPPLPLEPLSERWEHATCVPIPCEPTTGAPRLHFEMSRRDYERKVARAIDYIYAGDIYQVNLAQRFRLSGIDDPLRAYARLRRVNPAPYAAFLSWGGGAIASVSPELFLHIGGRDVLTCPIKGTRPRRGDRLLDTAAQRELLESAKDAAELAMIVDLHRNDLGRVCEFGSVQVRNARHLEAHATVFHTVADVVGRLRTGLNALDALAACFPAGSISGVPKIRALQIIDELEPAARGVYTGAVGALGLDGRMTMNVAIRTVQFCGSDAWVYGGGGIVADSDPADEYDETLAKVRGIFAGLGVAGSQPIGGATCTAPDAAAAVAVGSDRT